MTSTHYTPGRRERHSEKDESWASLAEIDPLRSRIELFDMVWWVYFRRLQPVQPVSPI